MLRPVLIARLSEAGLGTLSALVPTGGAVYAIVFIALTLLFLRRCGEVDLPPEQSLTVVLAGAIGAMVGTRLFFLITTGALFRLTPFEWVDPSRGTASWGAT
ncbi:MAG: hypothetical protein ABI637_08150, partial [Gemmatimonadota bacterium]